MHRSLTALLVITLLAGMSFAADGPERTDLSAEDLARVRAVTAPAMDFTKPEKFELLPAGAATNKKLVNRDSFSLFSANLGFEDQERFNLGNGFFTKVWVPAPSSTQASDGLGPLFNARSCQNCHLKDGRGHPPMGADDDGVSMFLRISVPPHTDAEKALMASGEKNVIAEPTYGTQLQNFGITGLKAEGRMVIDYTDLPVTLGDGSVVTLREPHYSVADLGYGPMARDVLLSPRIAPPMIGLGLVEAIAQEDILARADPDDADHDGISGKPNWVRSLETGKIALGRFGWKDGAPSIRTQSAGAFAGDIGIATPLNNAPFGDCTAAEGECLSYPTGEQERLGVAEAPDPILDLVTFYSQNLAVPQRRDLDKPEVLRGKQAFYSIGCIACHTPKYVTSREATNPGQRFQLIWPYSDFLLHDLGDGLADLRPEAQADGFEWRTSPLWGIGLTETVSGHTFLLHDGRARNVTEAVLWHGGEAQAAREAFANLPKSSRDDLLAFLGSL
ncbi:MAG: thiol oxidoreductase [Devosia nanyangense]|uniref:Thiol oxidoreductase n=1 Tax=Devosia nanyangense TaxID=1228055 RepID=A0A933L567_9HYPH|nr:thiol oxidoreductase [Devosia nanyangense]